MPMSPEARALIEAERRRHGSASARPSREARERVKRKVFSAVGVGIGSLSAASTGIAGTTAATSAGAATAPAVGVATITKVGLGAKALGILALAVVGTGIVGGGIYAARSKADAAPVPSTPVPSAPVPSTPVPSTLAPSNPPQTALASDPPAAPARARLADEAVAPTASAGPRPAEAAASTPRPRPTTAAAAPASADDLASETALLAKAHGALGAGRYDDALAVTSEHARRFPKGSLSTERQAIRAIALCAAGRKPEGRAEAGSLLDRSGTPLGDRIAAACR